MLRHGALALLAGCALATPVPQGLDFDAIDALHEISTPSIPVVNAHAAETTLAFAPSAAASQVAAAVLANPDDTTVAKRGAIVMADPNQSQCKTGRAIDDTAEQFSSDSRYSSSATSAATPAGYEQAYQNKNGSSEGVFGYMGYSVLDSYDTLTCSQRCDQIKGCQSFNIYFGKSTILPQHPNPTAS